MNKYPCQNELNVLVKPKNVEKVSGLNKLIIRAPRGGPPGRDVDVRLKGNDLETLKNASSELLKIVNTIPSVSAVNDNFEEGVQERVVVLNNRGRALGFSISEIGSQIRTAQITIGIAIII